MEICFKDVIATGKHACAPSSEVLNYFINCIIFILINFSYIDVDKYYLVDSDYPTMIGY